MSDQLTELTQYFERIIERSLSGEIAWSQVSPTIFVAERLTPSGNMKMSIQQAFSSPSQAARRRAEADAAVTSGAAAFAPGDIIGGIAQGVERSGGARAFVATAESSAKYLFQVLAFARGTPELSIDSAQHSELQPVLERLYQAAKQSVGLQAKRILMELAES